MIRNLRHSIRLLIRSPGFTIAAVATLALGIGANTAIYSLIKTVLLHPLPYGHPDALIVVWNPANRTDVTHLSLQEILGYRDATSFAQFDAYTEVSANLTGWAEPERVRAAAVTADLFNTLGVSAIAGRVFVTGDGDPGAADTVVLGHSLWQRRFGGSSGIVGQSIHVNGRPRTVVGVMPATFRLPLDYRADRPSELWFPLVIDRANLGQWGSRSLFGIGRLASGVEPSVATSELRLIADRWIAAGVVIDQGDGGLFRSAIPVPDLITGNVRLPLFILLGAVGVVLLIACANVVNLLLAKAEARRREVAVRTAIGATRGNILSQLLTESVVLSVLGGLAALVVARAAMQVLTTLRPARLPRVEDAAIDATALAFTGGLAVSTGVLFGLAPALQLARQGIHGSLNEGGRGAPSHVRLAVRRALVIVQLAFSVVLVVGAGLLVRTVIELYRIDLGFNPRGVLTAQLQLPATDYPTAQGVIDFYRQLTERLEGLAGVSAAGAARILPLARTIGDWSITIEGRPYVRSENPNGDFQAVTPGYFRAMGTTLLRGRFLTAADREDAPPIVIINDTMAARYWPGEDAIGKRFRMGGPGGTLPFMTIVGIVRTSRHNAVVEEPRAEMYLPHAQLPVTVGAPGRALALVVKSDADPLALVSPLRETVRSLDPNLPLADIQSMEQVTATALSGPRFAALLLSLFAALALSLAAVGTYATIALLVSQRAHEIGIRMALGAERRTILRWILGDGLTLAGVGIAIGVLGAIFLTRVLETLLYGVGTRDPLTFVMVPALLATVAIMASLHPARRAASVDPVSTLRQA